MTEMIERVSKVIREQRGCFYDDIARMAIEAMREPSGLTCMHGITMSERPSQTCLCHTAFNVLIDAALSEDRE